MATSELAGPAPLHNPLVNISVVNVANCDVYS